MAARIQLALTHAVVAETGPLSSGAIEVPSLSTKGDDGAQAYHVPPIRAPLLVSELSESFQPSLIHASAVLVQ